MTTILSNGVTVHDMRWNPGSEFNECCFGFIDPSELYIGDTHHAKIIYDLIESGKHSWESLTNARQKWGWIHRKNAMWGSAFNKLPDDALVVSFTSDEASQTHDEELSKKVTDSIGEYFNQPAFVNPEVGEGYTNAGEYGERSKEQYFGTREYCVHCGEPYDPTDEAEASEHEHERICPTCDQYYDPQDYHERQEHALPYCEHCGVHYEPEYADEHEHNEEEKVGSHELYVQPPAIYRIVDLRDREVFAKLSVDYYNQGSDDVNPAIGSIWIDDTGEPHRVVSIQPTEYGEDRVYYSLPNGSGHMSVQAFKYFMKPAPTDSTGKTIDNWSEDPHPTTVTPEATTPVNQNQKWEVSVTNTREDKLIRDNPALLAIEKNPKSEEWRWSYDGKQLHIWRVLSRYMYGPSHYDMFGHEGYEDHSQGRVYVSPNGLVGVLYWQISHSECESVLNQWVEQHFGKEPDLVYRAYGGYKGYPTPRWYFPVVEVSGLPIKDKDRWWERSQEKPDMWYYDRGLTNPKKKNKGYPATKQKNNVVPIVGPVDDYGQPVNPSKNKKRPRKRNKKYRNRSRR